MASSWYSLIKHVDAEAGFVLIHLNSSDPAVVLSVEEALDRAEAINGLKVENQITHNQVKELYIAFMEATLLARRQQASMMKENKYVDFALKNRHLRQLELYNAQRGIVSGGYYRST